MGRGISFTALVMSVGGIGLELIIRHRLKRLRNLPYFLHAIVAAAAFLTLFG